jgi:Skp family chaperone for outer membrane proteins
MVSIAAFAFHAAAREPDAKPAVQPIAVCDLNQLLMDLMKSDRYDPEIKKRYQETTAESKALYDEAMKKYEEAHRAGETGPEAEKRQEDYDKAYEKYTERRNELRKSYEKLWMDKYADAYEEVKRAAVRTATDHGYTYLLTSDTSEESLPKTDARTQYDARHTRRVLMFPEGTDITQDIRELLRIQKAPKDEPRDEDDR